MVVLLGGQGCRGRLRGLVSRTRGSGGVPDLFLRDYYTPYDDCMLRCLSGCFGVAMFCCGPGVCPRRRCHGQIRRVAHLMGSVRFRRPIGLVRNRCSPRRFFRVTGNLRSMPRNNRHYFGYCHLHVRRTTGLTRRNNCSCFAAALSVDPLGGTTGVGRVKRRLTRVCRIRRLPSSFGGGGNCGHSVRLSRRCSLCHRGCYNYICSQERTRGEGWDDGRGCMACDRCPIGGGGIY